MQARTDTTSTLSTNLDAMLDECKTTAADLTPPPPIQPAAPMAWPPGFGREWMYIDNAGVEQGPFFLHEMRGCALQHATYTSQTYTIPFSCTKVCAYTHNATFVRTVMCPHCR
jgi:hypothetical protein